MLAWDDLLLALRARWRDKPGLMFKLFLSGYLAWRLAIDAIKPLRYDYGAGMGGVQLVCLAALLCYLPLLARQLGVPAPLKAIEP